MAGPNAPLIAHIIYRLDVGGLENGLVNLVNRLPHDHSRHVIVCLAGIDPEFRRRIARPDVEVVSLDKKPGKDIAVYGRFWRALRRMRPTVVHTRNLGTVDLQWIAAAAGIPHRVHGEHGWEVSDPRGLNSKSLRIRRACRPFIHRYVTMSQDIARWLEREVGVPARRIRQIYSGVDAKRFCPTFIASVGEVARSAGAGLLTIGTIGRLDPVKNQAALIDVVAILRARFPNLRLLIVGDGPLRRELAARASAAGLDQAIEFTGNRSDTPDLLRRMDVFVLPSVNEGISNTILEAMATGLPVVAARVGGNPELVLEGATGALYDPADPEALEAAIVPYLTDPARRVSHGRAGRERVVQNFSLEGMVQRYQALYDELLASAPTSAKRERAGVRAL